MHIQYVFYLLKGVGREGVCIECFEVSIVLQTLQQNRPLACILSEAVSRHSLEDSIALQFTQKTNGPPPMKQIQFLQQGLRVYTPTKKFIVAYRMPLTWRNAEQNLKTCIHHRQRE